MKESTVYNYGIVGAGVAGLQLAIAMLEDPNFEHIKLAIFEPLVKNISDKTLCFWEEGVGKWDDLITHSWDSGQFINVDGGVTALKLGDYRYKMLPSGRLYNYALDLIKSDQRVTWVSEKVESITESGGQVSINLSNSSYHVIHCFDSRVDIDYQDIQKTHAMVYQPFLGWEVTFEEDTFDPSSFTMMDYQYRKDNDTAFFYILPTSQRTALVEYTLFTPELIDMEQYKSHIHEYIQRYISQSTYSIKDTETGLIPMSMYPFHNTSMRSITKIGTAGSWVRPSSGYAFKHIEQNIDKMLSNIVSNKEPRHNLLHKRHRMMDRLMIDLLQNENHIGPTLFETMYAKIPISIIFKFLDGKTSFMQDIRIMNTFKWAPFFRAIKRQYF